jgi:hypothetical protein
MLHPALQVGVGFLFLFVGIPLYVRQGGIGPLLVFVIGAILVTVGAVVVNIRQLLRDESRRREQDVKPVLNI